MSEHNRLIDALNSDAPEVDTPAMRPQELGAFIGQEKLRENLTIAVGAARQRDDVLDHILFYGPPGLGKTTLAQIVAREMGVGFRQTSGPMITKAGDLAALLTNLQPKDVLFIDEIHRLSTSVEEVLYSAMEDFQLDLIIGEGPAARSVRVDLSPFTLVGATTRRGLLTNPLQDRFGIVQRLEFYAPDELAHIVTRGAKLLGVAIQAEGALEIAGRSRGTPRIAGRLLRRVRDFAMVMGGGGIDLATARAALDRLDVDAAGLDEMDRRFLQCMAENYGGGPVGVETLAAAVSEQRDMLEDVLDPYLLQQGFIQRTPRGRVLARKGWEHLGRPIPANSAVFQSGQGTMFEDEQ